MSIKKCTVFAALILSAGGVMAQSTTLMVDVGPCINYESAIKRFACYENQVDAALNGGIDTAGSPAAPPAPAAAQKAPAVQSRDPVRSRDQENTPVATVNIPAATPPQASSPQPPAPAENAVAVNDSFGFPEKESDKVKKVLNSVISDLDEIKPGTYLITLENGQVWRQVHSASRFRMQPGYHVAVSPSRWGKDYRMTVEELKGFIQVERVR